MYMKLSAATAAVILTSACTGLQERINKDVDQTNEKASTLLRDVGNHSSGVVAKSTSAAVHEEGLWLGKKIVKLKEPTLPPVFFEETTFDRSVNSLTELAERITLRSGVPTKVSADALAVAAGAPASGTTSATVQTDLPGRPRSAEGAARANVSGQSTPVRIIYTKGSFKGFLDTVAARFGVYWKYTNGSIQFFHTDSRTFQINAVPGDSSFTASVTSGAASAGGSGGNGGGTQGGSGNGVTSSNTQNTSVASQLSVYSSMEKSILAMISPYGKVVASPATGTITVVDTPDALDRVAAFIENENKALAKQIVINVTVLAVTLNDGDEYGINWNLVYNKLRNEYGIENTFGTSTGSAAFSAGILQNSPFAGSSLIINALSEQGKVRRHTTASVVTLNNQPVPLQVARQTSYLRSSQTSTPAVAGPTMTSLTPGTVTSGFNMSILPHILDNGTVLLQFSTDISSLRSIRVVETNDRRDKIETPEIDTRNFLQRVAMKSNETLIISGFEQTEENLDKRGLGTPDNFLLGGGSRAKSNKEIIVILITPTTTAGS